jgi:hypothetical protein
MNYIYYLLNGKFQVEKHDKKILKVLKEQRNFPIKLPKPIKLSELVNIYDKFLNNEFDSSDSSK